MKKMFKISFALVALIITISSCQTTRVSVVDGDIVKIEKTIRLTKAPDTIYYRTLSDGEIITQEEYDKRWERAVNRAMKKIEKQNKNGR
jgi:hypothetical protein